jgi:hypothetical protein
VGEVLVVMAEDEPGEPVVVEGEGDFGVLRPARKGVRVRLDLLQALVPALVADG